MANVVTHCYTTGGKIRKIEGANSSNAHEIYYFAYPPQKTESFQVELRGVKASRKTHRKKGNVAPPLLRFFQQACKKVRCPAKTYNMSSIILCCSDRCEIVTFDCRQLVSSQTRTKTSRAISRSLQEEITCDSYLIYIPLFRVCGALRV